MKTTIRLDDELYLAARHKALDERISFQELVETAVRQYLGWKSAKERKNAKRTKQ